MVLIVCQPKQPRPTVRPEVLSPQYAAENCFGKIFIVKSKITRCNVRLSSVCLFLMDDAINTRKSKFIVNHGVSDNLLRQMCKRIMIVILLYGCN